MSSVYKVLAEHLQLLCEGDARLGRGAGAALLQLLGFFGWLDI